jgi:predicted permease
MNVISQVFVLFIVLVLGYICSRAKIAGREAADAISPIILNVTLPCMLLMAFQRPFSGELLTEAGMAVAASAVMYGIEIPLAFVFPYVFRQRGPERGVHRYAILFTNCGFIGYPIVEAVLGPEYIFHACLFNIFFSFLAYSAGAWLIAKEGERPIKISRKTFINPCSIATLTGFLLFLFSIKLPEALHQSIKITGEITSPLSMLVIGINLAQVSAGEVWGRWRIYITVFLRLIFLPFLVGLVCRLLGIRGSLLALAIIITAMPAASTTSIMSSLYRAAPAEGSALVFISTLFSIATIPVMVLILRALPL